MDPLSQSSTDKIKTDKETNYFLLAIGAIIIGFGLILAIFLWAFPENNIGSESEANVKTTSSQITSTQDLNQAENELDQADFVSFEKDLDSNSKDSAGF